MTGSHTSSTEGSAAARPATSGPIPAGSPTVIATRGLVVIVSAGTALVPPAHHGLLVFARSATAGAATAGAATAGATARRVVAAALAAAPAVHLTLGIRQLVPQTALEAPAQSG